MENLRCTGMPVIKSVFILLNGDEWDFALTMDALAFEIYCDLIALYYGTTGLKIKKIILNE